MIRRFTSAYSPIGVSIGAHTVSLIQLARTGHRQHVAAHARYRRLDTDEAGLSLREAQRLADFLILKGFRGTELSVCPPQTLTPSCLIELPSTAAADPVALIHEEFGRMHQIDPGHVEVAAWSVGGPPSSNASEGTEVFAVGCAHTAIEPTLDHIESTGLSITRLGAIPTALAAYTQKLQTAETNSSQSIHAVVNLDAGQSTLTLVDGGTAFYHSLLPCGGLFAVLQHAFGEQKQALTLYRRWLLEGLSEADDQQRTFARIIEQVARDIIDTLNLDLTRASAYVQQRHPGQNITGFSLTGDAVCLPPLQSRLREGITATPTNDPQPTDGFATALGLLIDEASSIDINPSVSSTSHPRRAA